MTALAKGIAAGLVCMLAACFDDADRCGPNMTYDSERAECLCAPNAITAEGGCKACAADEVVVAGACGCAAGEAKNDAGVCAAVAGLGDTCGADAPCTDATYSICAPSTAGTTSGTCTKSCTSDADCGATYTCATWEAQPYCREFSGLGKSCSGQADCANQDAALCDVIQSHACIVQGCSLSANDCPRDMTCCDLSNFGVGTACLLECP